MKKNCNILVSGAFFRFLLTICLMTGAVFSVFFIFPHLEHERAAEHCPVCLQFGGAGGLIKHLAAAGIALFMVCTGFRGLQGPLKPGRFVSHLFYTAVTLKVQLNN
ncbi:MAG: hypothetical protein LBE14_02120 [Treponema sp.]|nr:hypothetical protein [Treponema sp.]